MGANLKEVRERIASVKSTQQITKAMKMVSAAKLRRAQDAIVQMRPYSEKLNEMARHILSNTDGDAATKFSTKRTVEHALIVVITSNRGLCGAFNSNIIKEAKSLLNGKFKNAAEAGKVTMLCIGKKGFDHFKKTIPAERMISDHVNLFNDLSLDAVVEVPTEIIEDFHAEKYDAVEVCYGRFKNAAVQEAEAAQFLPVPQMKVNEDKTSKMRADYIFEPNKEELLEALIPSILQTQLHRYMLDTHASEHGARMTAMDSATENADELLKDLKISYNKARQAGITSQISEIVGGVAALDG